jgi:hypothetical protein
MSQNIPVEFFRSDRYWNEGKGVKEDYFSLRCAVQITVEKMMHPHGGSISDTSSSRGNTSCPEKPTRFVAYVMTFIQSVFDGWFKVTSLSCVSVTWDYDNKVRTTKRAWHKLEPFWPILTRWHMHATKPSDIVWKKPISCQPRVHFVMSIPLSRDSKQFSHRKWHGSSVIIDETSKWSTKSAVMKMIDQVWRWWI